MPAPRNSNTFALRAFALSILMVSLYFMVLRLSYVPGINGDEAYHAVHRDRAEGLEKLWGMTTAGRILAPSYSAFSVLAQAIAPQSLLALRLPALFSGVLFLLLGLGLLPRVLPPSAGWGALLLIATLPLHLAYLRIGWEVCQIPLLVLGCVAAAWARRWGWAWLTYFCAIWVHTSSVLLGLFAFMPRILEIWADFQTKKRFSLKKFRVDVLGAAAVIAMALVQSKGKEKPLMYPIQFFTGFLDTLSGSSVYAGFATPVSPTSQAGMALLAFLGVALAAWGLKRLCRTDLKVRHFVYGYLAMLFLTFLTTGATAFRPEYTRYAVFIGVPTCVLVALGWQNLPGFSRRPPLLAMLASCLFLLSFHQNYFQAIARDGASAHESYWTGTEEPKAAAFAAIAASSSKATVFVENFWIYWVFRHLGGKPWDERLVADDPLKKQDAKALLTQGNILVGFAGQTWDRELQGSGAKRTAWKSGGGKETVVIWWP